MRETLRRYHSEKRANQKLDDLYYQQDSEAVARRFLPDDIPIYQSSLSTDVVDQVSDQLRTDEPHVAFGALTDSDREMKRKAQLEGWGKQVILDDQLGQDIDAYSQAGKDLALRGEAVIKRLHNTDMPRKPVLTDFPGRGRKERHEEALHKWEAEIAATSPLYPARAVDPLNIFVPPNAVNPLPYIIEYQVREQVDIWAQYPNWKAGETGEGGGISARVWSVDGENKEQRKLTDDELNDPLREVDRLEYWSKDLPDKPGRYIILIDGIQVLDTENPYGFVPYAHAYSGLGRTDERASSAAKAASILSKIRGELTSEIVLKTIMFELSQSYVFPRIIGPEGREEIIRAGMKHRGILTYDPADVNGADSIKWLDPVPITSAVSEFLAEAQNAIARRVNPILSGQGNQDSEFGVLEALRIGQATKGIQEITVNLNRLATTSVRQAAQMLIALDKDMTVTATEANGFPRDFTVNPATFKNYKQLTIEFEATDALEQTRKQQAGMTLFRGGAISRRTLQTQHLAEIVDDPVMEDERMGVEATESAWFASEEFLAYAVATFRGLQAEQEAQRQRDAAGAAVINQGANGAGDVEASRTSTVEALTGGGATAAERDNAQAVTSQVAP